MSDQEDQQKRAKVKPELPGGFRDYLPQEMIPRQRMLDAIRRVYERFGFDPIETPGMEYRRVLTGEDPDFRMTLYETRTSGSRIVFNPADDPDRTALRFDHTVPLARVVAASQGGVDEGAQKFRLPFKRYAAGNVWRGEKPQAGRFREFMQFDADIVGSSSPYADAEIIALMVETMRELGVEHFVVRFNDRKLLNGLQPYAGYDAGGHVDVLRTIDKLPKIKRDGVLRELSNPPRDVRAGGEQAPAQEEGAENVEAVYGLGLSREIADRLGAYLDLSGTTDELLDRAASLLAGVTLAEEGIGELRAIVTALRKMGVPEEYWRFDHTIVRGLGYYTGPVFEMFLTKPDGSNIEGFGSVFSGGRFDDLVDRFGAGSIPATGASIGVDRLFDYLGRLGKITVQPTLAQVLVTVMDSGKMPEYLAMTGELRAAGFRTILWVGLESAFKAQMAYARGQEIPVIVIAGERELSAGKVAVRDMTARDQQEYPRGELVEVVRRILKPSA